MFLNGCVFTAVNAAFIAVCCFQTEQQSKFTSDTHSFDMQPCERTGEMRLSHCCHSRTQSNLDYWSWTGYFSEIESWICKSCFDRYIDSGGSGGEAWGARAPLFLETNWGPKLFLGEPPPTDLALVEMYIYTQQYEFFLGIQGSKLTLANSQNASDFDNLRVRKISTSKRLRVRIIHVSQTKGNNLLVVSPVC